MKITDMVHTVKEMPVKTLRNYALLLGTVIGGWIFCTEYFALAGDLTQLQNNTQKELVELKLDSEISTNEMQMDIIEDRIERAQKNNNLPKAFLLHVCLHTRDRENL